MPKRLRDFVPAINQVNDGTNLAEDNHGRDNNLKDNEVSSVTLTGHDKSIKYLERLSVHSLQVELQRRRLPTSGLRHHLRKRLLDHLVAHPSYFISVPLKFPTLIQPPHLDPSSPQNIPRDLQSVSTFVPMATSKTESQHLLQCEKEKTRSKKLKSTVGEVSLVDKYPLKGKHFGLASGDGAQNLPRPEEYTLESPQQPSQYNPVIGVLRWRTVWICGEHNMRAFWHHMGPLGKASLSRSSPSYFVHDQQSWRGRAARQLLELEGKSNGARADDIAEENGTDKLDPSRANLEHVQLTLVEAYYAAFVKKAIRLQDEVGNPLTNAPYAWKLFCDRGGRHFPATFVVYCRYRTAGWIPRSGLKYGTDWVLYPANTRRHTHSPFCLVLRHRDGAPIGMDRTWVSLQNRIRLVKNVAKTLIIAEVITAPDMDIVSDIRVAFQAVSVSELTIDRWVP